MEAETKTAISHNGTVRPYVTNIPKARMLIDDTITIDMLCDSLIEGTSLVQFSRQHGITAPTLHEWVRENPERFARVKAAQAISAERFADKALEAIQDIDDDARNGSIARQRELAAHYRWAAKVADPSRYSDKVQVQAEVTHKRDPNELASQLSSMIDALAIEGTFTRASETPLLEDDSGNT